VPSPEQLFGAVRAADPARPLVTFYDDRSGERAELSAASLGNWIAKTKFLLTDELGLGVGDRAFVRLPLHWLDLAVLFGVWFAGLTVVDDPDSLDGAAVAFVDEAGAAAVVASGSVDEIYALALAPWGRGFDGAPPPGTADYVSAVRPQADAWASVRVAAPDSAPALGSVSRADLSGAAHDRAAELGLTAGARLLVGEAAPGAGLDVATLLAPFTVGGSLVLLRHAPAQAGDARIAPERITAIALAGGA
jgi:uncharacterized protein (TIGR03089 family)